MLTPIFSSQSLWSPGEELPTLRQGKAALVTCEKKKKKNAVHALVIFHLAIENAPLRVDLPIQNGDFP